MITLATALFAIGIACMALEALDVATAFFSAAVVLMRYAA
jgi:hypothetical protein